MRFCLRFVVSVSLTIYAVVLTANLQGDVRLPSVFSDEMVLQRGMHTPVWGWADAGESIQVRFAGQEATAEADASGRWIARLNPMEANAAGQSLEVRGKNTITLNNVLVGDIWICSGQSNMEWPLSATLQAEEEMRNANHPNLRLFQVPGHTTARVAQSEGRGRWQVCTTDNVRGFSAVGYFFGRRLLLEAKVPVGLIGSNWGGTRIEPWTPPVGFRNVPELSELAARVNATDWYSEEGRANWVRYTEQMEKWIAATREAATKATALPEPIEIPGSLDPGQPCTIYNSMIHPLVPFGIRGVIWYQGESNGGEGVEYFHKMQALIGGWRSVWNQADVPILFYFVQLANFEQAHDNPQGGDGYARVREAQRKALTIPHTGMATIIDIGEANDIHPRNKQDVGWRLAQWALRDVHGHEGAVCGPLFREMKIEENKVRILFDQVGPGLMVGRKQGLEPTQEVTGGELKRFAIAGEDKVWHWGRAVIDGESVVVSSDQVAKPVAVRYAFSMNPEGANLYNKLGFPASPFRTDDW